MKEFDSPAELAALDGVYQEFTLRGVEFRAYADMDQKDFGRMTAIGANAHEGDMAAEISDAIRNTLHPDYRARWDDLLGQYLDPPITFETISAIGTFLMAGATGRPTTSPAPSTTTAARTATGSTDESGSRAAQASETSRSVPV